MDDVLKNPTISQMYDSMVMQGVQPKNDAEILSEYATNNMSYNNPNNNTSISYQTIVNKNIMAMIAVMCYESIGAEQLDADTVNNANARMNLKGDQSKNIDMFTQSEFVFNIKFPAVMSKNNGLLSFFPLYRASTLSQSSSQ